MNEFRPVPDEINQLTQAFWKRLEERRCQPRATYRLEFHRDHLTFQDAKELVPYLAALGISHVYACPYLKAVSGGANAYAIVDPTQLNPELGSETDYNEFVAALKAHGMGQILDIVPNHMSTAVAENSWWTDILEHGQCSPYARYFDIDWAPVEPSLRNRVLLPVLGDDFGRVLEQGDLKFVHSDGVFELHYFEHHFPLDPSSYSSILEVLLSKIRQQQERTEREGTELESILTALRHLPERTASEALLVEERLRETRVIQNRIRSLVESSSIVAQLLAETLNELNGQPGNADSFNRMEEILDRQIYRLSKWKAASDEINYRRFFDVNELAAICTENREVFEASHALIFELLMKGAIEGVRVDHVDGLFDPSQYLWRLQWGYLERLVDQIWKEQENNDETRWGELRTPVLEAIHAKLGGPPPDAVQRDTPDTGSADSDSTPPQPLQTQLPLYVLVEKILGPNESLPEDWPVAGTTGYDFMSSLVRFFVRPHGFEKIQRNYRRFAGISDHYSEVLLASKRMVLETAMSSELHLLAQRLNRLTRTQRHTRDFTLNSLVAALRELIVSFPVYRTYVKGNFISARDRALIQETVRLTRRRNPAMDSHLLGWIRKLLLGELESSAYERTQIDLFIGRFQQVTSPVMAKGVEDTTFYRYFPLAAGNEVGGSPVITPLSVEDFHQENKARIEKYPQAMLSTSTHDTKRSEDVRARISTLSEVPDLWRTAVGRWTRMNRHFRTDLHGERSPTPNDEYLFYQTLVGLWPVEPLEEASHYELVQRVLRYLEKAVREEKVLSSWISPNSEYESAVSRFAELALRYDPKNRFLNDVVELTREILPASLLKSTAQVLLKMTCPGVPDIYQGQELWDDSLVDPDNRRRVDYSQRRRLLQEVIQRVNASPESRSQFIRELSARPTDPTFKLFVTWKALSVRKQYPDLFLKGSYVPLEVQGPLAENFIAFQRCLNSVTLTVILPRFPYALLSPVRGDFTRLHELEQLKETHVAWNAGNLATVNQFTGVHIPPSHGEFSLAELFKDFPLGLFLTE